MSRYKIMQLGVDKDYLEYTSPSAIKGQLSKGDALVQWAVNQAVNYIKDNCYSIAGYSPCKLDLEDARYAWKNTRDKTADIGSTFHNLAETFVNVKISNGNENHFMKVVISNLPYNLRQLFYQFWVWQKNNVKRFIESEKPVLHRALCSAGTLDFIYEGFDGKIYVADLKTSSFKPYKRDYKLNGYYDTDEMQVAFYTKARENMEGQYKVQFTQDGNTWTKIFNYEKLKVNGCKVLYFERDYFNLSDHDIRDIKNSQECYELLLTFYYKRCRRQLNNARAKRRG